MYPIKANNKVKLLKLKLIDTSVKIIIPISRYNILFIFLIITLTFGSIIFLKALIESYKNLSVTLQKLDKL